MHTIRYYLVFAAILFVSCNDRIRGNGEFIDEARNIPDYSGVTSTGDFDVYLTNESTGTLRLHGESNVLPNVETVVDGNMLVIAFEEGITGEHGTVSIYVPAFGVEQVVLQGSGSVKADDTLDTPGFALELTGSGDANLLYSGSHIATTVSGSGNVTVSGRANESNYTITGSGNINAANHAVHKCNVIISGFGEAIVNTDSILDASITGSGNVRYRGNPSVVNKHVITGSGTVTAE